MPGCPAPGARCCCPAGTASVPEGGREGVYPAEGVSLFPRAPHSPTGRLTHHPCVSRAPLARSPSRCPPASRAGFRTGPGAAAGRRTPPWRCSSGRPQGRRQREAGDPAVTAATAAAVRAPLGPSLAGPGRRPRSCSLRSSLPTVWLRWDVPPETQVVRPVPNI